MIDFRIEKLHNQGDVVLFGQGEKRIQSRCAILNALSVTQTFTISRERDDIEDPRFSGFRDELFVDFPKSRVVRRIVKGALDTAETTFVFRCRGDRAGQAKICDF